MKKLQIFERLAWTAGLLLLGSYVAVRAHGEFAKRQDLARFERARQQNLQEVTPATNPDPRSARIHAQLPVDFDLWSDQRVAAYEETLGLDAGLPLAVLRIPTIDLEVPVLEGTDDLALNRAVGRIEGTARIGEAGNVGIAGHRDSFFRGLKDVSQGDVIELVTLDRSESYVVEDIWIVDPESVEVLDSTALESITLVTCYPFYYVGSAPQRYIVRAVRSGAREIAQN